MKKLVCICGALLIAYGVKAQDLVVTSAGDSVNCTINQEAEGYLYLTINHKGENRNITIEKSKIAGYQKGYYGTPKQEAVKPSSVITSHRSEVKETVPISAPIPPRAYEQLENTPVRIRAYGNYIYSSPYLPQWNIGVSAGLRLNRNWEMGVGIDYSSTTFGYYTSDGQGGTTIVQETSIYGLMGDVYVCYYQPIVHRLFFTPRITLGYGGEKEEGYTSEKSTLLGLGLTPTLTFFANKHVGFSVSMGGLQLVVPDWEWDSRRFVASFNPTYWQWGMIMVF